MAKIYVGNKFAVECNHAQIQGYVKIYFQMMLEGKIDKSIIKIKTSTKTFEIKETQFWREHQNEVSNEVITT